MRTETTTTVSDYVDLHPVNGYEIVHDVSKGQIESITVQPDYRNDRKQLYKDSQPVASPEFNVKLHYTIVYKKIEIT